MVRKLILLFTLMSLTNSPALSEQRLGSWTRLTSQLCYPGGGGYDPILVNNTVFIYEGLTMSDLSTPRPYEMSTILPSGELSSWVIVPDSKLGEVGYTDVYTISAHGYLYAFGGWNYELVDGFSTSVLRSKINPGKDQILGPWEKIQTWVENMGGTKLFYNNRVYVFGGWASKEVKYYEIFSDGSVSTCSYSTTQLNHDRLDSSALMIDSCVFITGGVSGGINQVERAVIYPDGEVGAFTDISMTMALHKRPGLVKVGNYLYVLGGVWGGNFEYRDEHTLINPDLTLGPWQKGPYFPEPRYSNFLRTDMGVYAIGGTIYGVNNDGPTTYVDFAPIIEGTDVEDKYWSELE